MNRIFLKKLCVRYSWLQRTIRRLAACVPYQVRLGENFRRCYAFFEDSQDRPIDRRLGCELDRSRLGDLVYKLAFSGYNKIIKPVRGPSPATVAGNSGNWHGNDSAWRMTVDLANIIHFADADGGLRATPQRKLFCLVNGIIGGEKDGPLVPKAKASGCLVAGNNPWAVDLTTTRLMGFDVRKIKMFSIACKDFLDGGGAPPRPLRLLTDHGEIEGASFFSPQNGDAPLAFEPRFAWASHSEIGAVPAAGRAA